MQTQQPDWKLLSNLGDVDPLTYGGLFVYEDRTGIYPPECELIEITNNENVQPYARVYRFILEPCTHIDGVLSDNRFHPGKPAWFAESLASMADFAGCTVENLTALFCSSNPCERAQAWQTVGEFHGFENLDSYSLTFNKQATYRRYQFRVNILNKQRKAVTS